VLQDGWSIFDAVLVAVGFAGAVAQLATGNSDWAALSAVRTVYLLHLVILLPNMHTLR
jgi:hypothetical protein